MRKVLTLALLLVLPMVGSAQQQPGIDFKGVGSGGVTLVAISSTSAQASGTSEEVIKSYTTSPSELAKSGDAFRIKTSITSAANANAKTIRLRIGGLTGAQVFLLAGGNNTIWDIEIHVMRGSAANAQVIITRYNGSSAGTSIPGTATSTVDLSAASSLDLTFQCAVAATDMTFNFWSIERLRP